MKGNLYRIWLMPQMTLHAVMSPINNDEPYSSQMFMTFIFASKDGKIC